MRPTVSRSNNFLSAELPVKKDFHATPLFKTTKVHQTGSAGFFRSYMNTLSQALSLTEISDLKGDYLDQENAMLVLCQMSEKLRDNNATLFFIGNGASAAMASHMAADFCKNGRIRSLSFNDIALMTAVSNDVSYVESFSVPLKRFAQKDDLLITVSSSGNSPNIIQAILAARQIGIPVVTFSGMERTNKSRKLGDLNIYFPANSYGLVEAGHQALLHCWLDMYLSRSNLDDKQNAVSL